MTSRSDRLTSDRTSSSGCVTSAAVAPRSATNSAILRVYASASVARSSAFLNRAVAISSIVRVILRMFCTDLRRLTIARALAIGGSRGSSGRRGRGDGERSPRASAGRGGAVRCGSDPREGGGRGRRRTPGAGLEVVQRRLQVGDDRVGQLLVADEGGAELRALVVDELEEVRLPARDLL